MAEPSTKRVAFACLLVTLLFGGHAIAQTVTGTISGTVTDPSGLVIAGANVTLTNDRTGESRTAITNELGTFTFTAVQPSTYSLKVELTGFKTSQRTGMVLSATERLSVGQIQLALGAPSETVTVEASGAAVQTSSAEQSALISSAQIDTMLARGRDVTSLLKILPGVHYAADQEAMGGSYGVTTPNVSGVSNAANTLEVDGLLHNDMGTPSVFSGPISMDAIGEVKMLLNNYQAEYTGNGGAVMNIVTKSGGRDYHGSAYWFKRHEMFNANSFFNNRNNIAKPRYRYNTLGGTIGGPIYIPKMFNSNKNRLFGFYSLEDWKAKIPQDIRQVTTPTDLERAGDFSQTLDVSNKLVVIKDPLTGKAFQDNRIPSTRINKNGQAILSVLPRPNFLDRTISKGNYNYQFQESLNHPKRGHTFKVDFVASNKDRISVRGTKWFADMDGYACASCPSNWGLTREHYYFTDGGAVLSYTHIFNPKVVNELTAGWRHNREKWYSDSPEEEQKIVKAHYGITLGQWYPQNNPMGIIPMAYFGGVTGAANITYDDRVLTGGADTTISVNNNLSIMRGSHMFKFGIAVNRTREYEGEGRVLGRFYFSRDTNNPNDSNWAYSNALLGNFYSYEESNTSYGRNVRGTYIDWFAQDSWRVNRRLTIDYGMRFTRYNALRIPEKYAGQAAILALERYDSKKAAVLYRPALNASGKRMAQNPLTGEFAPALMIGAFVPGSGDYAPGMVLNGDKSYPDGWTETKPVLYGPRLGIAYDPFGRGKTAIRAGGAIFYQPRVSRWSYILNPPARLTPILYYGNLDTYLQSAGVVFPSATNSFEREEKPQAVYNLSFGVQQDIGFATMLDVSYVSTLGRRLLGTRNLNTLPYGARFLAANQDPTNPGKPLPDSFLVPMPGFGTVTYRDCALSSNYHSLRVVANRRFAKGLQFGVAYVYSKTMDYSTSSPIYRPIRVWNYGKSSMDQTHSMVINYIWDVPKASKLWPNPLVRFVFDSWQVSGITSLISGVPSGVGFSTTDGADLSGGGDGTRINVTGKAQLPHGERTFTRWFDPTVFARPAKGDPGNAPREVFRLPGINNWDISLFKNVPVLKENRYFQFRFEMYNAFNHTQYSSVNTTASFDPQGKQGNALFGTVTATRAARVMQMSLRFAF
jgi:hypothetical protein